MSIDFEIPAEAKAIREKVRQWVHDECIPAEKELDTKPLAEVLGPLRAKARARGLWCPWVPKEYGGMGLGPLANALVPTARNIRRRSSSSPCSTATSGSASR
jgi:acyl-CoA dehydrogenase